MKEFFIRWINTTVAVLIAAHIIPGIGYDRFADLIVASLLLGILNAIARPILMLLSLPLLLLTLGLFLLVINAGLLYLVGWMVKGFHVGGFWAAFFGALVISIASMFLNALTGTGKGNVKVKSSSSREQEKRRDDDKGGGPIIDV
ncbi:MAG TPA: phage holin family protein [Verrucomicrobiae bacterium]